MQIGPTLTLRQPRSVAGHGVADLLPRDHNRRKARLIAERAHEIDRVDVHHPMSEAERHERVRWRGGAAIRSAVCWLAVTQA